MEKFNINFEKFLNKHQEKFQRFVLLIGSTLFVSYLLASTINTSFIAVLGKEAMINLSKPVVASSYPVKIKKDLNFLKIRKTIESRNIFNSEGKLPDEKDPNFKEDQNHQVVFDESAECSDATGLNIELKGTIAMGAKSPHSLATIQEKGYEIADVYRVGEPIIGNEQAIINSILWRKVIINNDGKKECLNLKDEPLPFELATNSNSNEGSKKPTQEDVVSSTVILENAYVMDALASGFAKVLKDGRFVPYNQNNKLIGFKLIGVRQNSLYTKAGLSNGDVLTSVNGVSMAKAEQGFAFLSMLAEEKEVRVEFLRGGNEPSTVTIQIK